MNNGCAKDKYLALSLMSMQLREMGEFGLMRLVEDRLHALRAWLSSEDLKQVAIDIQSRSL